MTEQATQTNQTATGQTAQSAQATDATQATQSTNTGSTSTTTGTTTGSTTTVQPTQATDAAQATQPTNTATTGSTTSTTATDQPAAKELTQKEFWVSGMLNGTFYECDGPYYTTKDIPAENYPYTTIKPDPNFTSQKYDYLKHKWVDTSADALLHEMESIKTNIKGFQQTAATLQQGLASQSQAQEAKDKETGKAMSLLSMVIKQMGTVSDKIYGMSTKLNKNSSTAQTATTAPAGSTTPAATTAQTGSATSTGSTTPTGSATPTATTAQTADETKKEGTK